MFVLLQSWVQEQAYDCNFQPGRRVWMSCVVTWMCPISLIFHNTYISLLTFSSYLHMNTLTCLYQKLLLERWYKQVLLCNICPFPCLGFVLLPLSSRLFPSILLASLYEFLQFDHCSSPCWFLCSSGLMGSSLAACLAILDMLPKSWLSFPYSLLLRVLFTWRLVVSHTLLEGSLPITRV